MLDTPWVSTPRRSVMVSTSAASAASSAVTPSFSKIRVTVSRRAVSDTRTWSFSGTLKRSRIMGSFPPAGNPSRLRRPAAVLDFQAGGLHHARTGFGLVARPHDVPEGAVLAEGRRPDPEGGPGAPPEERAG